MTPDAPNQAARLRQMLESDSTPGECDAARAQLTELIEREFAGEAVDSLPAFAALLRHLDHCEDCTALYEGLSADFEAMLDTSTPLPAAPPALPRSTVVRQSEQVLVRVLAGLARQFELLLRPPAPGPSLPTLGGNQTVLFNDTLPEVPGSPVVSVVLLADGATATLLVAVREADAQANWQVRLLAGTTPYAAVSAEDGITRFRGVALADLASMTITATRH